MREASAPPLREDGTSGFLQAQGLRALRRTKHAHRSALTMSRDPGPLANQIGDLPDDRMRRIHERVRSVEPELGPGGLFKNLVLGSVDMPLDPEEYRRRRGSAFSTTTPAFEVRNPPQLNRRIQLVMKRIRGVPEIVVLMQPGQVTWFPILDGYLFEASSFPPVISCDAR